MLKELKIDRLRGAMRVMRKGLLWERSEERSSEALLRCVAEEDSSGGTRGQLVGGTVEVQVFDFGDQKRALHPQGRRRSR